VVTSIDGDGFSVTLDEPFVEVRVDLAALPYDRLELDDLGIRLTNRAGFGYALGDQVTVRIGEIDLGTRTVRGVPIRPPARIDRGSGESAPRQSRDGGQRGRSDAPRGRGEASRGRSEAPRSRSDAPRSKARAPERAPEPRREPKPKKHVVVSRKEATAVRPRYEREQAPVREAMDGPLTPAVPFDERAWQERLKNKKARRAEKRDGGVRKKGPRG
jgi:hypothetical protein